ncbi:COG3593 Predicted ATP-dependent endonuclease of the OLD family [Comamonadaceae bacterium]
MKIKRMYVEKLNQRITANVTFNDSLNVITGSNGSGKTTFLKACWYLFSGNVSNAIREIDFQKMEIETDQLTLSIQCVGSDSEDPKYIIRAIPAQGIRFQTNEIIESLATPTSGTWDEIKDNLWRYQFITALNHDSLFFPTFRRVEGGFSLGNQNDRPIRSKRAVFNIDNSNDDELTKALRATSKALTEFDNKFICSMSTSDVEKLVADTKAKMDSKQKEEYEVLAANISTNIRNWQTAGGEDSKGADYLRGILKNVTDVEEERDRIVQPMRSLNYEISQYFPNRTIEINGIKLGDGVNNVAAASLSAGEKQMLSFLCYAALYNNYIFMVDEPELSLHLDWQRKLISSLTSLGSSHQYFFVTHSPAIYTKFGDFEISFDKFLY